MPYPVDLTTNPGDPISPITGRPNHGPYANSTGDRYIFSNAFPLTGGSGGSIRIIGAYKSTDNGATWHEQDAGSHAVVYDFPAAGNPEPSNTVCPHPSNPALVTVFFFSSYTVLSARDFNIELGIWSGAAYGGAWPFVASGAEFPTFSDVVARPIANEFVIFGMTSDGAGHGRMQFVRLAPGGGFSAAIDAFPGAAAGDVITELASCTLACSADETVYALAEQVNFGGGVDNLVQCKLDPSNSAFGSFVDFYGAIFPTNPLGQYSGNGRLYAAADKVFLVLGFAPTVGITQAYAGWVLQGLDFTFPYAFGVVNATAESDTPSASVNYGKVYYWFRDSTNAVFVVSVESPAAVAPVLSSVFAASVFFPNVNLLLQEVRDIGGGVIGAIGYSPSGIGLVASYWESVKLPPLGPPVPPIIVVSGSPPMGQVNAPYPPFCFAASGGTAPYVFSISGGSLPPGLGLDPGGCITALAPTTAQAGTFCFTVLVTDSTLATGALDVCITILRDTIILLYGWKVYKLDPCDDSFSPAIEVPPVKRAV